MENETHYKVAKEMMIEQRGRLSYYKEDPHEKLWHWHSMSIKLSTLKIFFI